MPKRLFLVIAGLASVFATQGTTQGTFISGEAWTTDFVESCSLPSATSLQVVEVDADKKLQITLAPDDIGTCGTDNMARHRAPFWERAELSQSSRMQLGGRYHITAEVTFVSGFQGERETFFQIHGWNPDCTKAYPPMMMKFSQGQLRIETLRGVSLFSAGRHRTVLKDQIEIVSLYGRPLELGITLDTRTRPGRLSVHLDGETLVKEQPVDFSKCATPYVKFGIYRPGGKGSATSTVIYDDVRIEDIRE